MIETYIKANISADGRYQHQMHIKYKPGKRRGLSSSSDLDETTLRSAKKSRRDIFIQLRQKLHRSRDGPRHLDPGFDTAISTSSSEETSDKSDTESVFSHEADTTTKVVPVVSHDTMTRGRTYTSCQEVHHVHPQGVNVKNEHPDPLLSSHISLHEKSTPQAPLPASSRSPSTEDKHPNDDDQLSSTQKVKTVVRPRKLMFRSQLHTRYLPHRTQPIHRNDVQQLYAQYRLDCIRRHVEDAQAYVSTLEEGFPIALGVLVGGILLLALMV